jgi:hypothetical protein
MIYELDKPREIIIKMRAMDNFEKKTGKSLMSMDTNAMTISDMATLIWAGFNDKDITPDNVIDLIDKYSSLEEASLVLEKTMSESFPKGEKTKKSGK